METTMLYDGTGAEGNGNHNVTTTVTLKDESGKAIGKRAAIHNVFFGATLQDMIGAQGGGEEGMRRVLAAAYVGLKIDFQNYVRPCLEAGRMDLIETAESTWQYGKKPQLTSLASQVVKLAGNASRDDLREAMRAILTQRGLSAAQIEQALQVL